MNITITAPSFASEGMADDADPATGPVCNYNGPGNGRCNDGTAFSSANPTSATNVTATAQAMIGPAPAGTAEANAKGEAKSTVTVTYNWWERILAIFDFKQKITAAVDMSVFAYVSTGPNQATFAVFLTGGPGSTPNPIPVYQGAYNFDPSAADPNILDVKKDNNAAGTIPNGGVYTDRNVGPSADVEPGNYDLTFEMNAVAEADGQVTIGATGVLRLFQA